MRTKVILLLACLSIASSPIWSKDDKKEEKRKTEDKMDLKWVIDEESIPRSILHSILHPTDMGSYVLITFNHKVGSSIVIVKDATGAILYNSSWPIEKGTELTFRDTEQYPYSVTISTTEKEITGKISVVTN